MAKRTDFTLRLKGDKELAGKLNQDIAAAPVRRFFVRAGILVQTKAKEKTPNYRGTTAASIVYEIDPRRLPRFVRIGSELATADYMEGGTGLLRDLPGGSGQRHWPPGGPGTPLDVWASRHPRTTESGGIWTGRDVAAIIGRRGGLRPRRMLREGLEETRPQIPSLLAQLSREIETENDIG